MCGHEVGQYRLIRQDEVERLVLAGTHREGLAHGLMAQSAQRHRIGAFGHLVTGPGAIVSDKSGEDGLSLDVLHGHGGEVHPGLIVVGQGIYVTGSHLEGRVFRSHHGDVHLGIACHTVLVADIDL